MLLSVNRVSYIGMTYNHKDEVTKSSNVEIRMYQDTPSLPLNPKSQTPESQKKETSFMMPVKCKRHNLER